MLRRTPQTGIIPKDQGKVEAITEHAVKNGLDITKCLLEEMLVKSGVPIKDKHTAHNKRVWEYRSIRWLNL